MPSVHTYTYATIGSLDLEIDFYSRESYGDLSLSQPVVLYFHAGGLVAFDRKCIPPHIVQACLSRRWGLASADYRLMPQAKGQDLLDDVKAAYRFVENQLSKLTGKQTVGDRTANEAKRDIIVAGASAGAYMAYLAGLYMEPKPLAVLSYYGVPTFEHGFFSSSKIFGPEAMKRSQIENYLAEPVTTGFTPPGQAFNPESLLSDGTPNREYAKPAPSTGASEGLPARAFLYDWFVQENEYLDLVKAVDKGPESSAWDDSPPTIVVHGDADDDVPVEISQMIVQVIGPEKAKLFTVPGAPHCFDGDFLLGDPKLVVVEEAWKALDVIVESTAKEM